MIKLFIYSFIVCFFGIGNFDSFSQSNFHILDKDSDKIRFNLINNLIVLPLELNGVRLSFLLDTGVSKPILFNITNTDSLQIKDVETIFLRGLGGGKSVKALKSRNNFVKIGKALNYSQDIFVVFDQNINFAPRLGVPIHGIIGYDLFKNFVVEINYSSKYIKLNNPKTYKYKSCRKCETFDLTFYNNKPYINAEVETTVSRQKVNLLIDTGSTDALWLFQNDSLGLIPNKNMQFEDFLGKGLSGNVYGKRSRINAFEIGNYKLENVNAAFPDSTTTRYARKIEDRNGSLSSEILKRFNLIVDYPSSKLTLRKNGNFKSPFKYDRSGIVLEQRGLRIVREKTNEEVSDKYGNKTSDNVTISLYDTYVYKLEPAYTIVEIRKDSPADKAGFKIGDIILSINSNSTHTMSLQDAMEYFQDKINKNLRISVEREGKEMRFQFKLQDPFKTKKLP